MDLDDTVVQADDRTFGTCIGRRFEITNPCLDQFTDFGWVQLHDFNPLETGLPVTDAHRT